MPRIEVNEGGVQTRRWCTSPYHQGSRWTYALFFRPTKRYQDGMPSALQSWCETCQRLNGRRTRPRAAERPAGAPVLGADRVRNLKLRVEAQARHVDQLELRLAQALDRIEALERQVRALNAVGPAPSRVARPASAPEAPSSPPVLPAVVDGRPFQAWLARMAKLYTLSEVAERAGVDVKRLREIKNRDFNEDGTSTLTLSFIDDVLTRFDGEDSLATLYPDI